MVYSQETNVSQAFTLLTSSDMRMILPRILWFGSMIPKKLGWTACSSVMKAKSNDFCTLLVPNDLRPMLLPGVRGSSMQRPSFVIPFPPSRISCSVSTSLGIRQPSSFIRIPTFKRNKKRNFRNSLIQNTLARLITPTVFRDLGEKNHTPFQIWSNGHRFQGTRGAERLNWLKDH